VGVPARIREQRKPPSTTPNDARGATASPPGVDDGEASQPTTARDPDGAR
jgi:hypothetical protein